MDIARVQVRTSRSTNLPGFQLGIPPRSQEKRFRPRILIDMSATVLGFKISMPIMVVPIAMQKMAHPEGEYATAGTIMTLLSGATYIVEEVALTGPVIRFFQLYIRIQALDEGKQYHVNETMGSNNNGYKSRPPSCTASRTPRSHNMILLSQSQSSASPPLLHSARLFSLLKPFSNCNLNLIMAGVGGGEGPSSSAVKA